MKPAKSGIWTRLTWFGGWDLALASFCL